MKRNLMAIFLLAAGGLLAQGRDGYGQRNGQPGYDQRPGYNQGGGYDPNYDQDYDPNYNPNYDPQGYVAQAPPAPMYGPGYRRPPMPGPGFVWVDGYWSWMRGRYVWVGGYWTRPPYVGSYWVAPRYRSGRFFAGFWAGSRHGGPRGGYGYRR
jgi:hypothetical protein